MRYLSTEVPKLIGKFTHGDTVTIDIYKLSDNSKVVNASACTELASTGYYYYESALAPASFEMYLWVMTNGDTSKDVYGELDLNGYPKTIADNIGTPVALDSGTASISGMLTKLADDNNGADFNAGTDSLHVLETKVVDATWDELASGHTTDGSYGNNLSSDLSDEMDLIVALSPGIGSLAVTYGLTLSDNGQPISNAKVWVSTDSAHANIVTSGSTDVFGIVNFNLDPGTYYVWRYKGGVNFTNPLQATFSAGVTSAVGTGTLTDTISTARIKVVTYSGSG